MDVNDSLFFSLVLFFFKHIHRHRHRYRYRSRYRIKTRVLNPSTYSTNDTTITVTAINYQPPPLTETTGRAKTTTRKLARNNVGEERKKPRKGCKSRKEIKPEPNTHTRSSVSTFVCLPILNGWVPIWVRSIGVGLPCQCCACDKFGCVRHTEKFTNIRTP